MLSDLIEIEEGIFQSSADGGHAAQCGTFQLLALEERLGILEQADEIARHDFDQMLRRRQLAQGNPEMIGIIEGVEEILVERMNILQTWEAVEDQGQLLAEGLLGKLDLASIEICPKSVWSSLIARWRVCLILLILLI